MTVTKEMIDAAWKKYREGCLAVRASKSDFMAGFEAALASRSAEAGKPVAHLVWRQYRRAADDVEDYYEVARPGDKSIDGSDPFAIYCDAVLAAKEAEIATYRAGIKRLSDEEELCAETTGDDPFSMVYLAAKLAAAEEALSALSTPADMPDGDVIDDAWEELINFDDRNSPEEYPTMCLITYDELAGFMRRLAAAPQPNPSAVDAYRLIERGQAFANQVRRITHLLHGQAYSTTVSELNAFDAALAAQGETP